MSTRSRLTAACRGAARLAAGAGALSMLASGARAQDVDELPEIVVEGANLGTAKAKPKVTKAQPGPATAQAPAAKPAAAPKPLAAKPAPAKKPSAAAAPATQAPPATATAPVEAEPVEAPAADASGSGEAAGGVPIDRVGSAVEVVTGAELKARQVRHAGDALRSLPGVSVSRATGVTGLTQVRMRGAEANHTLVLVDGIVANDATNGEFDFSDLSTDDIARIEVIRGPQSSIYGTGAVGGVINIVTSDGRGPLRFKVFGETGTFGTREGGFSVAAGSDDIWGRLSYAKRWTGGYNVATEGPENDGGKLASFAAKGGVRIAEGLVLDYTMRHTDKTGDRDTEDAGLGHLQEQQDDPATFATTTWLHGGRLTWTALDGGLTQAVSAKRNETHRTDQSPTFLFDTDFLGETITYDYTGTLRFDVPVGFGWKNALTWFVEDEKERFTPNSFSYDPFFPFADDGFARVRNRMAYAGEWQGDFADRLTVTAGVRHDDNDSFEDFTTWRTTATLRLPEIGLRPHGSAGTAVKAPTMFEQFGAIPRFFTPNPALVPEESFGWDAGLEIATRDRRHRLDVTYFEADLENAIDGLVFDSASGAFTSINREGTSLREGIEVAAATELVSGLTLSGSYTYLDAITSEGLSEFRRPRHAGRVDLDYAFDGGKGNFNVGAIYNGEMDDAVRRVTDVFFGFPVLTPERFTLDDYVVVNVAASYKVLPGVELYGRLENAFDEDYQEVFGFDTAGSAGYVGVRLTGTVEETRAWSEGR